MVVIMNILISSISLSWNINLFGFLIPVAGMKYMRSYFFGVEAEEVVVRGGDEDNIGLLGSTKIVN